MEGTAEEEEELAVEGRLGSIISLCYSTTFRSFRAPPRLVLMMETSIKIEFLSG